MTIPTAFPNPNYVATTGAGTSSTVTGHPMERCFRDIHVMSTHRALQLDLATENWATAHYGLSAPPGLRASG